MAVRARTHALLFAAATAVVTAALAACGNSPTDVDANCQGSGGVVFRLEGVLDTAMSPFSAGQVVGGCIRVAAAAVIDGNVSSVPADLLGFQLQLGRESWRGSGFSMVQTLPVPLRGGGLRFSIADDGARLVFEYGGSLSPSDPGRFYFAFHEAEAGRTGLTVTSGSSSGGLNSMTSSQRAAGTVDILR